MSDEYVVYKDSVVSEESKIHRATCYYYLHRDKSASTVEWYGPFSTIADAERETGVTRRAGCPGPDCLDS